jgi:hypothetical protein
MGYSHGHEINACAEAGSEADVPTPSTSANTKLRLFGQERFSYDPAQDGYRCPAGAELTCRFETTELGRHSRYDATRACRRCPIQAQCTSNNDGRSITRLVDEQTLARMEARRTATPAIMQERTQRVEHPFGTITHANDQGSCLMTGRKNVRAEFSLSCLAYTLTRVINILSVPRLLVALG